MITINDAGLLRRLAEGPLRCDGVTDYQRERLETLVLSRHVVGARIDRMFHYQITDKGRGAIT